jgi:hypothetical protein
MKIVRYLLSLAVVAGVLLLGAAALDRSPSRPPKVEAIELAPDGGARSGPDASRARERERRNAPGFDSGAAREVSNPPPAPAGRDDEAAAGALEDDDSPGGEADDDEGADDGEDDESDDGDD